MLSDTVDHLIHNVLEAAADYARAEEALTAALNTSGTSRGQQAAARTAKRRAAELAIAVDGLTDRCSIELGVSKSSIRTDVSALCLYPGSGAARHGAHNRIRGVANAYKHKDLTDPNLPIASESDVLVVGAGWGIDGWGVGKYGGEEVLIRERDGKVYKMLGDAPVSIAAWFKFLASKGAVLPGGPYNVCSLQVHP